MSSQQFMINSNKPFSYPAELQTIKFQTMYLDSHTLHFLCIIQCFMHRNAWKICLVSKSTVPLTMNIYLLKLSKFTPTR